MFITSKCPAGAMQTLRGRNGHAGGRWSELAPRRSHVPGIGVPLRPAGPGVGKAANWGDDVGGERGAGGGHDARRVVARPAAAMFRRGTEGWPSGLRRTLGKRVCVKAYRGFESHSLRQRIRDINTLFDVGANVPPSVPTMRAGRG